ncbi:MAG TPA: pitrilysin family protein [Longimicrobiales bacterium]|nr:pitrilysin family protein [Longimicrobiales bacterium]
MSRIQFQFHRRTLKNGLRVVVSPDRARPVVAVNLWYGVGSRNERSGRTGFAHLFEHMMFQGSAHVPKNRHFELVERAGGSLNASTWFDRTNYFETLPSHRLDLALWLESDRMGWMVEAMTQEKLDNQRDVVKNEKRERYDNQPYGDWQERIQQMLWPPGHPYRHTVIGSMEDLDAAKLEDVADFFRTFYVPNNAVLTVAGDVEVEDAFRRVERYFGEIPRGAPVPPIPGDSRVPIPMEAPVTEVVEADVPLPRVMMAYRVPAFTDPRFPALDVAAAVLGSGRASRLYRSLVRTGVARDAFAYPFPLVTGASFLLVGATGFPDTDPLALADAVRGELATLTEVHPAEVERGLALEEARLVRALEQMGERADRISMSTMLFDRPERVNQEVDELRAVTLEDVQAAASDYLVDQPHATLAYQPRTAAEVAA